ncbi:MAG: hypothetical protein QM762_24720 [Chryseolinea sp.]
MKPCVLFVVLCLLTVSACDEDFQDCDVSDPMELSWFREMTDALGKNSLSEYMYVMQGDYKNKRVYISANCCPMCNSVVIVYDCSGNQLGYLGHGEDHIAPEAITNQSIAWKSSSNVCAFM